MGWAVQKLILFLLLFSPLLLASARPVWQLFWVIYVSVLLFGLIGFGLITKGRYFTLTNKLPSASVAGISLFFMAGLYQVWTFSSPELVGNATFFLSQGISYLFFMLIIFQTLKKRDDAAKFLIQISNIIFLFSAIGFVVYVTGNDYVLWFEKTAYRDSLTSTFINRNSFATYVGIGLLLSVMELRMVVSTIEKGAPIDRHFVRENIQLFLTKGWKVLIKVLLLGVVLLLTVSRAGVFVSLLMLGVYLAVASGLYTRGAGLRMKIATLGLFIAGGLALFAFSGDKLDKRLSLNITEDARAAAFPQIIEGIKDKPLLGHGAGSFEDVFAAYRPADLPVYFDRAHNDYLEIAFTLGVPAALALFGAFLAVCWKLKRALYYTQAYREHLLVILVIAGQLGLHSLVDFSLQMPAVAYTFLAILSVGLVIADKSVKQGKKISG